MASPAALIALRDALKAEQQKRARIRGQAPQMSREELYKWLDQMHERRKAAPGYVEPTPAQRALTLQDLDRYLSEHYGSRRGL